MAEAQNPANPQSQGAGDEGDKNKLFFGKYKSIEEAEAGYKELERGFHGQAQEISKLNRTIEERLPVQPSQGGYSHDGARAASADPNAAAQFLTQFYSDPIGTIAAVKEVTKREVYEDSRRAADEAGKNRSRVASWATNNQDVMQYPDLLEYYSSRTDSRLSIETRLDDAAKQVRKRVAELKGPNGNNGAGPGPVIEAPSGGNEAPAAPPKAPVGGPSAESQLASYASARNTASRKPLNVRGRAK